MDRAKDPSVIPSAAELINKLIDVGHAEGSLLAPPGSELRGIIQSMGSALKYSGGKKLMLQAHGAVRDRLGATCTAVSRPLMEGHITEHLFLHVQLAVGRGIGMRKDNLLRIGYRTYCLGDSALQPAL